MIRKIVNLPIEDALCARSALFRIAVERRGRRGRAGFKTARFTDVLLAASVSLANAARETSSWCAMRAVISVALSSCFSSRRLKSGTEFQGVALPHG